MNLRLEIRCSLMGYDLLDIGFDTVPAGAYPIRRWTQDQGRIFATVLLCPADYKPAALITP
jgi:hypothetical protein